MVNFLTQIPDCSSHSLALMNSFLSSDASIFSTTTLPLLRNSDHVVVSVIIDFLSNSKQDASFHCIAYDHLHLIEMVFVVIWEMLHRMIYLNSELLLLLVNLVIRFRLELMNISLMISIRSSLTHLHGFQLLALLAYFIEITFFVPSKYWI